MDGRCAAPDALSHSPARRFRAVPMVKPRLSRALALVAAGLVLAGAGLTAHHFADRLLRQEGAALLGPVSKVIVFALFVFLLLLACRHLCMLALAAWDHWLHAGDASRDA